MDTLNILAASLNWSPIIFYPAVLFVTVWVYFWPKTQPVLPKLYFWLSVSVIGFRVLLNLVQSITQYIVWSRDGLGRVFLTLPLDEASPSILNNLPWIFHQPKGYYLYYILSRFWQDTLIIILVAFFIWLLLRLVKNYKPAFFLPQDLPLVFLASLILGWPNLILLVPLVLILAVVLYLFEIILKRQLYSALGLLVLIALVVIFFCGNSIMGYLSLNFLFY